MDILVFGAGGIGGYFGARLVASGERAIFVARGAHGAAMRRDGLTVHSPRGDLSLSRVETVERAADAGAVDAVLLCTKMGGLAAAAEAVRPLLRPETAVVPLQNGVEAVDVLRRLLPEGNVLGGVAYVSAHIEAPGAIRHNTQHARIVFGEPDGRRSARAIALQNALDAAGIETELTDDVERAVWEKFCALAPLAGACSYMRTDIGGVRADPDGRQLLNALIAECVAVGRARGVALPDDAAATIQARVDELGGAIKPSMLVDLERGRPMELDWLTGATVRLGQQAGVDTPASRKVYDALKPYAAGGEAA